MKEQLKDIGMCLLIGLVLALAIWMPALVQIVRAETVSPVFSPPMVALGGVRPDGTSAAIHLDRDGYVRLGDEDIKRIVKALRADEAKDENMRLFDDTCLALMEEAMRSVDREMSPKDGDSIPMSWLFVVQRKQWDQWQETKRECWAKP